MCLFDMKESRESRINRRHGYFRSKHNMYTALSARMSFASLLHSGNNIVSDPTWS